MDITSLRILVGQHPQHACQRMCASLVAAGSWPGGFIAWWHYCLIANSAAPGPREGGREATVVHWNLLGSSRSTDAGLVEGGERHHLGLHGWHEGDDGLRLQLGRVEGEVHNALQGREAGGMGRRGGHRGSTEEHFVCGKRPAITGSSPEVESRPAHPLAHPLMVATCACAIRVGLLVA